MTVFVSIVIIVLLIYAIFIRNTAKKYIEILKTGNIHERANAALRLRYYNSHESIQPLINAMNDPYYEIRANAIETLGIIGARSALPTILAKIESYEEHNWVRQAGTRALKYLGREKQIPLLIKLLNDEDIGVRKEAIWSLSRVAGSSAIPILQNELEKPDCAWKEIIKYELFILGDANYIPFIIKALDGNEYEKMKARDLLDKYIDNPCCGYNSNSWYAWWKHNKNTILWDNTINKYMISAD